MAQSGSAAFTDPDDDHAGIGVSDANISLVPTGDAEFKARLTWLEQGEFCLLVGRESVPRIALHIPGANAGVCFVFRNC